MMHLLIIAYSNCNDAEGVKNALARFNAMYFKLSTPVMNTVLKSHINTSPLDDWNQFMQAYSDIFRANSLEPDHNTFTLLLQACAKGNRVQDSILIIDEMNESGVQMTSLAKDTFRQIVGDDIYEKLSENFPKIYVPDEYRKLSNFTAVDKTLNFKKLWGVLPRRETAGDIMRNDPNNFEILRKKIEDGDYYPATRHYASIGDVVSVLNLMDEMLSKGYKHDLEMMNTLLIAFSKSGDMVGVERTLNDMFAMKIRPNISSLRIVIHAYASLGNIEGAQQALSRATSLNYVPGNILYLSNLFGRE
jgi:pentatricopeptide repeat protein